MFDDKKEVEPMLEDEKGPTFQFCCEIAKQYSCYVAAGYPRKDGRFIFPDLPLTAARCKVLQFTMFCNPRRCAFTHI